MQLIETPIVTRQVTAAMDDDQYRLLPLHLLQRPDAGETIRASGGLRKLRWRLPGRGKRAMVISNVLRRHSDNRRMQFYCLI